MQTTRPLPVLFEDDRFIAVNKPAGILSIPGRDPHERSVSQILKRERKQSVFVVHRIDRETSGVLLFAKTEDAHRIANGWFRDHLMRKEYVAFAEGAPRLPAFRVNTPIEDKPSLSQIQITERFEGAFFSRIRIASGRRHQIRIHLASLQFPVLGDTKYGGKRNFAGMRFDRVALHAEFLVLPAADGFPAAEIRAPLPEDFEQWLAEFRKLGKVSAK